MNDYVDKISRMVRHIEVWNFRMAFPLASNIHEFGSERFQVDIMNHYGDLSIVIEKKYDIERVQDEIYHKALQLRSTLIIFISAWLAQMIG